LRTRPKRAQNNLLILLSSPFLKPNATSTLNGRRSSIDATTFAPRLETNPCTAASSIKTSHDWRPKNPRFGKASNTEISTGQMPTHHHFQMPYVLSYLMLNLSPAQEEHIQVIIKTSVRNRLKQYESKVALKD